MNLNSKIMSLISSLGPEVRKNNESISLSEVISALSFALDLTENAVPGHALRSCLIGMRLAAEAELPEDQRANLYYALLLKDAGCSSNAARMCQIVGGDDRAMKAGAKLEDWTKPHKPRLATLQLLWKQVLPWATPLHRISRILMIGFTQHSNNREMISLRCERGANIVSKLGMGDLAREAVRHLDEHWDGGGYPDSLIGEKIPFLSRICAVAQHLDVFATEYGTQRAIEVLNQRSGTWFDPELVRVAMALHRSNTLWISCLTGDNLEQTRKAVLALDPGKGQYLASNRIDEICEAFADVVDAKSPFTFRHSLGVADVAYEIAKAMDLPQDRVQLIRRAALLHDIGKLSVPNSILDKQGSLTDEERLLVEEHPDLTRRILERVDAFRELATIASQHHEKLDGSGYPRNLVADQLSLEARIIAVADVYAALREERPYRAGLETDQIVAIMQELTPHKLDAYCTAVLFLAVLPKQGQNGANSEYSPSRIRSIFGGQGKPSAATAQTTTPARTAFTESPAVKAEVVADLA